MSPRRRLADEEPDFFAVSPRPARRWGLPLVATLAGVLLAAALTFSTMMLVSDQSDRRGDLRAVAIHRDWFAAGGGSGWVRRHERRRYHRINAGFSHAAQLFH